MGLPGNMGFQQDRSFIFWAAQVKINKKNNREAQVMKRQKKQVWTDRKTAALATEVADKIKKADREGGHARQILDVIIALVAPGYRLVEGRG
jgi:predicted GNAT superfamily acetyltransferase